MELVIYRQLPGTHWWRDPWGGKHIATALADATIIVPTERKYRYDYGYGEEHNHDCTVFTDGEDREWAAVPPMDFGGSTGYLLLGPGTTDKWWRTYSHTAKLILTNGTPITSEAQLRALIEG